MSVGFSLFLAIIATGFMFFGLYALVIAVVEGKRGKAKPKLGICPGEKEGELGFWITWDAKQFAIEIYRLRVSFYSPESRVKEGMFTVTFDPAATEAFIQFVELPATFKELVTEGQVGKKANMMLAKDYYLGAVKAVYLGQKAKTPSLPKQKSVPADLPAVSTLDYFELVERKKKLKTLADEARAKAAKAKPAAAAPAPVAAAVEKPEG